MLRDTGPSRLFCAALSAPRKCFIQPCAHAVSAACACAGTWPHTASQDSSAPPRCSVVNRTAQAAAVPAAPSAASGCAPAAAPAPARGWELLEKPTVDGPEVLNDGALRRRVRSATPPSRDPRRRLCPRMEGHRRRCTIWLPCFVGNHAVQTAMPHSVHRTPFHLPVSVGGQVGALVDALARALDQFASTMPVGQLTLAATTPRRVKARLPVCA